MYRKLINDTNYSKLRQHSIFTFKLQILELQMKIMQISINVSGFKNSTNMEKTVCMEITMITIQGE